MFVIFKTNQIVWWFDFKAATVLGGLQSGQMQRTVNPSTMSSMVRIHPHPPNLICWRGSMVEQLTCNQQVGGSIPLTSSNYGWVPKRPKGTDCKSVGIRLRWFEPTPIHQKNKSILSALFCCPTPSWCGSYFIQTTL